MSASDAALLFFLAVRGAVALSLGVVLLLFHRRYPRTDLHRWALAFVAFAGFWVAASALLAAESRTDVSHPLRIALTILLPAAGYLGALLVAWGAWELALRRRVPFFAPKALVWTFAATAVATPLFLFALPDERRFQLSRPLPLQAIAAAAAFGWAGQRVWRSRASARAAGFTIFSFVFAAYAVALTGWSLAAFVVMARGRSFAAPAAS
ncbi:MAG TPA: hypothetical protein VGE86_06670, partial [Thermoanaerobaculia bacterium]